MYAYRPQGPRRSGGGRYLGVVDRVMLLIGLAAIVAMIISGFVTHGASILSALQTAFGR